MVEVVRALEPVDDASNMVAVVVRTFVVAAVVPVPDIHHDIDDDALVVVVVEAAVPVASAWKAAA